MSVPAGSLRVNEGDVFNYEEMTRKIPDEKGKKCYG